MDPDSGKEIEVDLDPDPERGSEWTRIRPNVVDPGGSRSATLHMYVKNDKTSLQFCCKLEVHKVFLIKIDQINDKMYTSNAKPPTPLHFCRSEKCFTGL